MAAGTTSDQFDRSSSRKTRKPQPFSAWTLHEDNSLVCLQCKDDGTRSAVAGYCRDCRDPLCTRCITQHEKSRASRTHKILPLHCAQCLEDQQVKVASAFCIECRDYLCSECSRQHKQFRATRSHHVTEGNDIMPFLRGDSVRTRVAGDKSSNSSRYQTESYKSCSTISYVNPKYRQHQPEHEMTVTKSQPIQHDTDKHKIKSADMIFQFDSNLKDDHRDSQIEVVLILPDTDLLLYDSANRKLKLFRERGRGKCYSVLHINTHIWDMCQSSKNPHEIYATLRNENTIFAINTNEVLRIDRQFNVKGKYLTSGIACWHSGLAVIASADVSKADLVSMVVDGGNQLQLFDHRGVLRHRMPCQITRSSELRPHCLASINGGNQLVVVVMGDAGWIVKCYDVRNMCVVYLYKMKDHLFLCSVTTDEEDNIYILAEKPHNNNIPEEGTDTNIHQLSPDGEYKGIVPHGVGRLSPSSLSYNITTQTVAVVLHKMGSQQSVLGIFRLR